MATDKSKGRGSAPGTTGTRSNSMVDLNREIVAPLQEFDSLARQVSEDMTNQLAPSMQTWASEATQSINAAQSAMQNFQMVASGAFMATADAMTAAGIAASVYGDNVGKAMEQAAKAAWPPFRSRRASTRLMLWRRVFGFSHNQSSSVIPTRRRRRPQILKRRRSGAPLPEWQAQRPPRCLAAEAPATTASHPAAPAGAGMEAHRKWAPTALPQARLEP